MDHVAIMKKSWGLLPKILSGQKTIESRWSKNKSTPFNKIAAGDIVYFKNSGCPVTVRAAVKKVLQFENLTPARVMEILNRYGPADGIGPDQIDYYYQLFRDKKNCVLVFLAKPQKITPFDINKSGFGSMSAWICTGDIFSIKVS